MANQSHFSAPDTPMPFRGTVNNLLGILGLMDLSVRIPERANIGIDRLSKMQLGAMTALMLAVSWFGNVHIGFSMFEGVGLNYGQDESLRNFALLDLGLGIWQRMKRLSEEKQGSDPHTWWPGDGWLNFIPLDRKYIDAYVEPFLILLAGALLRYRLGFGLLGLWLMVSAVAFFISERNWQAQKLNAVRSQKNLAKEGAWWAEFERTRPKGGAARTNENAPAVTMPTGIDDTLQALIDKNKLENPFEN